MKTLKIPSTTPALAVRASHASLVIVATDGQSQSDAALTMGRLLAPKDDALRVLTVVRPLPMITEAPVAMNPDIVAARRAAARRDVIAQMDRMLASPIDVELCEGDPATAIARAAHAAGATLVVTGLGRHRVADRMFGDETALRLIRMCDVPVYATASGVSHAPRRIVVACDFSETSLRAARLALEVAASGATIYLAHVAPRDSSLYDWNGWGSSYKQDAGDALQRTREQLHLPKDMAVQNVLLQGDAATELLAFATSVNADLIATGSHGRGFVTRMLVGSVATRIVRASTCSVLTVPHAAVMTRAGTTVQPPSVVRLRDQEWAAQLDDFTRRNLGRRGTLEVDDPEIDAQAQEFDYPLLGATYDKHDRRVDLMFGDEGAHRRHLTRSIGSVSSIEVVRAQSGKDLAIRIAHGPGLTLLTFSA